MNLLKRTLPIFASCVAFFVLVACGGGESADSSTPEVEAAQTTSNPLAVRKKPSGKGRIQIEIAVAGTGLHSKMTVNLSDVGFLNDLLDEDGNRVEGLNLRPTDLDQICFSSLRTRVGPADEPTACTVVHPGHRPPGFVCYGENGQPTSCPDTWLGDSEQVLIFSQVPNNDRGHFRVRVASTGKRYVLNPKTWTCSGGVVCSVTDQGLMEYGGYRPATGRFSCEGGVPTATIHFGTDAFVGFSPFPLRGQPLSFLRWQSVVPSAPIVGTSGIDRKGDFFLVIPGVPTEDQGTFLLQVFRNRQLVTATLDPAGFVWSQNVALDGGRISYALGNCP